MRTWETGLRAVCRSLAARSFSLVPAALCLASAAAAQQVLNPRDPPAVARHIRGQGFDCPAIEAVRLEGQTNRGNLYRVSCYLEDSDRAWWYQMILSPDESHVSLYPCAGEGRCPVFLP
ncbi:MAG: hypothetical protein QNJ94_15760 [Alphaproteobacteria bacterium]|nr:hypothetical protein [Alphaproteobacteria bacterium]